MTPLEARLSKAVTALRSENKLLPEGGSAVAFHLWCIERAVRTRIDGRAKDNGPIKLPKQREDRVPGHLPSVDEVIDPKEVTAAPSDSVVEANFELRSLNWLLNEQSVPKTVKCPSISASP